jgi:hypothetical protein
MSSSSKQPHIFLLSASSVFFAFLAVCLLFFPSSALCPCQPSHKCPSDTLERFCFGFDCAILYVYDSAQTKRIVVNNRQPPSDALGAGGALLAPLLEVEYFDREK